MTKKEKIINILRKIEIANDYDYSKLDRCLLGYKKVYGLFFDLGFADDVAEDILKEINKEE